MTKESLLKAALELKTEERLDLTEALRNSIQEPIEFQLTAEQRAELDRRIEDYRRNPGEGDGWEEVRAAIVEKHW